MKLIVKKNEIVIFTNSIIYILILYYFTNSLHLGAGGKFQIVLDSMGFSIVHAFFSSLLLIYYLRVLEKTIRHRTKSLYAMGLLSIVVYNHIACCKYIITPLYNGFIESSWEKLIGSLYIDLIILLMIFLWDRYNKKHIEAFLDKDLQINIKVWMIILLLFCYILIGLNVYVWKIGFILQLNSTLINFLDTFLLSCCVSMSVINLKKNNQTTKIGPLVLLFIVIAIGFFQSAVTGKRHNVITVFIFCFASLYALDKLKVKNIRIAVAFLPIILMAFSVSIYLFSGRFESINFWVIRDLVYRYDLSDFAITIATKTSFTDRSINSIIEAICAAIPGVSAENTQYLKIIALSGLSTIEDYNDTIFSIGAELAGIFGIMAVPLFLTLWLEFFDNFLKTRKSMAIRFTRLLIVFYFVNVEITWQIFALYTRNVLLAILIGSFIFFLSQKRKRKNGIWIR